MLEFWKIQLTISAAAVACTKFIEAFYASANKQNEKQEITVRLYQTSIMKDRSFISEMVLKHKYSSLYVFLERSLLKHIYSVLKRVKREPIFLNKMAR